jgi:hypothetical protein
MRKGTVLRCFIATICSIWSVSVLAQSNEIPKKLAVRENAWDIYSEWKRKIIHDLDMIKNEGKPGKVKRGQHPEVKLAKDKIYFDGKELRLGASLAAWMKIIPGTPRCTKPELSLCIWDNLGLSAGVEASGIHAIRYLNIQMSIADDDKNIGKADYPDGTPGDKPLDLSPHNVFPGYLEMDGFGIDSETEFWEIRKNADSDRLLRCGVIDCSHPSGAFGESAHIYLRLDGRSERGRLREVSLDAVD